MSEPPEPGIVAPESARILSTLNWLRAGVLGANDGIVSTAAIIFGVAGASATPATIMLAGIAAVAAGAMSMAVGEYVSVSAQRDLEKAELQREKDELAHDPEGQLAILTGLFEQRGVTATVAAEVAREMSEKDALSVHARAELGIDPQNVTNPWAAALASMLSFLVGGAIPIAALLLSPAAIEIWIAGVAVLIAMALTGFVSARLGRMPVGRSILRNVMGGLLALAITYGVGKMAGTQI
ncbi:MAG TPA: VIT family protein [Sphingomicrobium sp.]|nr:VIT family protein [Sphingomicrobium sp.]